MAITAAGYITSGDPLIYGYGTTADASLADALACLASAQIEIVDDDADTTDHHGHTLRRSNLHTHPATAALLALVEDRGGNCSWDVAGGVACTWDERDEADDPAKAARAARA
jgi:hypothetical protein